MRLRTTGRGERERIDSDPGSSLKTATFSGQRFEFHWHHHPEVELTLIRRGSGLRVVGASVESFVPGDLVLIAGAVPHSWATEGMQPQGVGSAVVQFPPAILAQLPEASALAGIMRLAARGLAGPPGQAGLVEDIFAARSPVERLGRLLCALDAARTWRPIASQAAAPRVRDPRVAQALDWLHDHAREPVALAALAARLNMEPSSLSRAIRRAVGTGPGEHLARLRIALCCRDLALGDGGLAEIALGNGFGNLASFHRWFRRIIGRSPDAWRRERQVAPR